MPIHLRKHFLSGWTILAILVTPFLLGAAVVVMVASLFPGGAATSKGFSVNVLWESLRYSAGLWIVGLLLAVTGWYAHRGYQAYLLKADAGQRPAAGTAKEPAPT